MGPAGSGPLKRVTEIASVLTTTDRGEILLWKLAQLHRSLRFRTLTVNPTMNPTGPAFSCCGLSVRQFNCTASR